MAEVVFTFFPLLDVMVYRGGYMAIGTDFNLIA